MLTIFAVIEWPCYFLILLVLRDCGQLYVANICMCKASILPFFRHAGVLTFMSLCRLEVCSENVVIVIEWIVIDLIIVILGS